MADDALQEMVLAGLVADVQNTVAKLVRFVTVYADNDLPINVSLTILSESKTTIGDQAGELAVAHRLLGQLAQLREEQVAERRSARG